MPKSPTPLTQEAFLIELKEQFPAIAAEVDDEDYQGIIHLQIGCLTRYANHCFATARLDELARILSFFQRTVERVDRVTENALYVSFLEHLALEGETVKAKQARQLLQRPYREIWQKLRAQ